jgi:ketosteroid isomerase-like protein
MSNTSLNQESVKSFVEGWSEGNFEKALGACAEGMTFQISGKSPLAGKYTKADFLEKLVVRLKSLSEGTYTFTAHDILVSELHATVLGSGTVTRNGKKTEYRTVHVFRLENSRPIAWYEYPRDLYAFDAIWG